MIKVATIVVDFGEFVSWEGAHTVLLMEDIAALCRCIVDNHSWWGGLRDLQGGCNILRTTLMVLSWYLKVDVVIDGLMNTFVRAEETVSTSCL